MSRKITHEDFKKIVDELNYVKRPRYPSVADMPIEDASPFIDQPIWDVPKEFAIKVAPVGAYITKEMNPNQPYRVEEIRDQIDKSVENGACACHIHVRGPHGERSLDPGLYHQVIDPLLEKYGDNLFIDGCPEGGKDFAASMTPLWEFRDVFETAPITCTASWWGNRARISGNEYVKACATVMNKLGIKQEIAVHDHGDISNAKRWLIDTGLVEKPYYFRICMGNPGMASIDTPQALIETTLDCVHRIMEIDIGSKIMLSMSGRSSLFGIALGAIIGPPIIGARVGMEDAIYMYPHKAELIHDTPAVVKQIVKFLEGIGRKAASAHAYRKFLGLI